MVTPKEQDTIQPDLAFSRPGVLSYVWNLGYGDILIEVFDDGHVRVNQQEVELVNPEKTASNASDGKVRQLTYLDLADVCPYN